MSKYEREVMNAVSLRGTVTVRELATQLDVSEQTVRRIVKPMVERGEIDKVHGAVVGQTRAGDPPFLARMSQNQVAKLAIATRVAALIADGDTIALDTGSTTGYIAQALRQHRDLTVVTNSAFIAISLATIPGNRVMMAGVELRNHDGASFDNQAFDVVRSMRVRYAVLSASAVDRRRGFMVHERCEAEMSKAMGAIADKRIIAVDHSKFGRLGLTTLEMSHPGDILVTDTKPPRGFTRVLDGLIVNAA